MPGVVSWLEQWFKPVGSGRASSFDCSLTPWLREPIECANDGVTREVDLIKPIQSGGTAAGEGVLLYWLSHWARGDICYYWPTDEAARNRWDKHFDRKLRACPPVMDRLPTERHKTNKCLWALPALNLVARGAFTDQSVASDSFRGEVLEECHDEEGWTPGRISQAFGRTTAYWDSIVFLISNAGILGGELHQRWKSGTMQLWEVRCPGCGLYHVMHSQLDRATGAGLLYSMEGQPEHAEPDYRRLAPTIKYQFECGFALPDVLGRRRKLSATGRYSAPTNQEAPLDHRSYSYEAVAVHDIPWLTLIKEKQTAWIARRSFGDPRLWNAYLRERECRFVDPLDRAEARPIVLSETRVKDREGLVNRVCRFAVGDFQEGVLSDRPHWWLLIMDFDEAGNGLVVFEGRLETDGLLIEAIRRHGVLGTSVCLDSRFNTDHILDLCASQGWGAYMSEGDKTYLHEDEVKRCYSEPEVLWPRARRIGPIFPEGHENKEPLFFLVSKDGALDLLGFQMSSEVRKYEIPGDVSKDFLRHFAAWTQEPRRRDAYSNVLVKKWVKKTEREPDHLRICATIISVLCDQAGLLDVPQAPEPAAEAAK